VPSPKGKENEGKSRRVTGGGDTGGIASLTGGAQGETGVAGIYLTSRGSKLTRIAVLCPNCGWKNRKTLVVGNSCDQRGTGK